MADATTIFDTNLLQIVGIIFAMLLVFVISYGFLSKVSIFGNQKGLYALIALGLALLVVISPQIRGIVLFMMPWLFVVIFISFFVLVTLMIFGLKEVNLLAGESTELRWTVLIIVIVLFIFALGNVLGQDSLEATQGPGGETVERPTPGPAPTNVSRSVATDDFQTNVWNTMINPQILGFIAIMLVAMFAIILLTRTAL